MNNPLDQKLSAHFQAQKKTPAPDAAFSARILAALPPPRPVSAAPLKWFAWDNQLATALIGIAVLLCLSFGRHTSGLDVINTSLTEAFSWLSMSSFTVTLGITIATLILFGDEDELVSAWT